MLHYAVNRPLGALLGESDLTTMLPWLQRYSRMLEDRVRLHLGRARLPVAGHRPRHQGQGKAGAVPHPARPRLDRGQRRERSSGKPSRPRPARRRRPHDMQAVRAMIDAGSGYPPHWRGDAGDISLATAQAMQGPTERHLRRRQQYFLWMLQDILYHAYQRAYQIGRVRRLISDNYAELFRTSLPEISRSDNESLSIAGKNIASAFADLSPMIARYPETCAVLMISTVFKFMGEPLPEEQIALLIQDIYKNPPLCRWDR